MSSLAWQQNPLMPEERGILNDSSLLKELKSIIQDTTQISQKQSQGPKVFLITRKKETMNRKQNKPHILYESTEERFWNLRGKY